MSIPIQQYLIGRAINIKAQTGRDVAIMASNQTVHGIGIDDRRSTQDCGTAIVNLIQGLGYIGGQRYICTTYQPTERCLGMAKTTALRDIYIPGAGNSVRRIRTNGNPPWVAQPYAIAPNQGTRVEAPAPPSFGIAGGVAVHVWANNLPAQSIGIQQADMLYNQIHPAVGQAPQFRRRLVNPGDAIPGAVATTGANAADRDTILLTLAFAIVGQDWQSGGMNVAMTGNNIGCVIVDASNDIISWGINSVQTHATLHGETVAVQRYQAWNAGAALPAGSRLYTTLEPCHMCSGVIAEAGNNIAVVYGQNDPGINNNALSRGINGCNQVHLAADNSAQAIETTTQQATGMTAVLNQLTGANNHRFRLTTHLGRTGTEHVMTAAVDRYTNLRQELGFGINSPEYRIWSAGMLLIQRQLR